MEKQESAHTGTVVGGLADALNWSTASSETFSAAMSGHASAQAAFNDAIQSGATKEDAFNAALAACNSEQERGQLITSTLNGLYGEMGQTYRDANADTIAARDAQAEFQTKLQELAEELQPLATDLTEFATSALGKVKEGLQWVIDNKDAVTTAFVAIGTGLAVFKGAQMVQGFVTALNAFKTATQSATIIQAAFNAVMNANPLMIVITLISALVAGLVWFFTQTEAGKQAWQAFTSFLGSAISSAGQFIQGAFSAVVSFFQGAVSSIVGFFSGIGDKIGGFFTRAANTAKKVWFNVKVTFKGIVNGIVGFFKGIGETISKPFRAAFDKIKSFWNSTIGGKGFTVPGWIPIVGGKEFRIPMLASGGVATSATIAMLGEGAADEAVMPLTSSTYKRIADGITEADDRSMGILIAWLDRNLEEIIARGAPGMTIREARRELGIA